MFGLLKKKLSTFSDKLKQTVGSKPEAEKGPSEGQKEIIRGEKPKAQEERKAEEKKAPEAKAEDKKAEPKKEEKGKKKTREELAEEMERKLFAEIEKEVGEEEKAGQPKKEAEKKTPEEKKREAEEELEAVEEAEGEIEEEEKKKAEEAEKETREEEAEEIGGRAGEKEKAEEEMKAPEEKKEKKKGLLGFVFGRGKEGKAEAAKEKRKAEGEAPAPKKEEKKKPLETIAEEVRAEEEKEEAPLRKAEEEKKKEALEEEAEDIEDELEEESSAEEEKLAAEEEQKKRMEEKRKRLEGVEIKGAEEDKRELKASIGAGGKIKGLIFGGVEIGEKDIAGLLEELELSLIESDVEQDAAREIVKQIRISLIGKKVSSKGLDEYLSGEIKRILTEMMATEQINVLESAKKKEQKPYRILMLGPNGAGKTTSIAKLTRYFQKNNMSCIWAAGDTFRAAAIDQLEEHAKRLNVRMIKQQYGADPAAVAFDAIRAAEASKTDVVIIDSAGRQETNKNLMEELKKMERVAKPDLKIYVGEAYAGQGLLDQASEFNEAIGIDGFILTKIDTDAKGGTTISLLYKLKKPILFVGTGQGYDDLREFSPEFILKRII
jgi:fused signal recognition particle receptor